MQAPPSLSPAPRARVMCVPHGQYSFGHNACRDALHLKEEADASAAESVTGVARMRDLRSLAGLQFRMQIGLLQFACWCSHSFICHIKGHQRSGCILLIHIALVESSIACDVNSAPTPGDGRGPHGRRAFCGRGAAAGPQ